jgi:hypothetical protein
LQLTPAIFQSSAPGGIYMQVFTCGGPSCECTYGKLSADTLCAVGSLPVAPVHLPPAPVMPVTITANSGFTLSDNSYTVTLSWTVPAGQPANAQYFIMPSGGGSGAQCGFVPDSIVAHQVGQYFSSTDTSGSLIIPASLLSNTGKCTPADMYMQVFTCGGPGCGCPTRANLSAWSCAPGSVPLAPTTSAAMKGKKKKKK